MPTDKAAQTSVPVRVLAVLAVGTLLYVAHSAFVPVALAILFALILTTPVEALHRHGVPRTAAALLILLMIVGLLGVCIRLYEAATERTFPRFSDHNPLHHDWVSVLMFALLAFSLYHFARKPLNTDKQ